MFSLASCSPSNLYISLPDSFRISQEHAKQLEQKLNASEIARKEAEAS
jgi:hypothetical protein